MSYVESGIEMCGVLSILTLLGVFIWGLMGRFE